MSCGQKLMNFIDDKHDHKTEHLHKKMLSTSFRLGALFFMHKIWFNGHFMSKNIRLQKAKPQEHVPGLLLFTTNIHRSYQIQGAPCHNWPCTYLSGISR